jgi:hypothetical protein
VPTLKEAFKETVHKRSCFTEIENMRRPRREFPRWRKQLVAKS